MATSRNILLDLIRNDSVYKLRKKSCVEVHPKRYFQIYNYRLLNLEKRVDKLLLESKQLDIDILNLKSKLVN